MSLNKEEGNAGWNDPPKLSYKEFLKYSELPKRNILNKRVVFPEHSISNCSLPTTNSTTATTSTSNVNLPPPSSCEARNYIACELENETELPQTASCKLRLDDEISMNVSSETRSEIHEERDMQMLNEILSNLDALMQNKSEWLKQNNKYESIKKKLSIMKESWEKNKLIPEVKTELQKLTFELRNGNKEEANKIQISLMVDHPKLCSEFMSAFRQLINAE